MTNLTAAGGAPDLGDIFGQAFSGDVWTKIRMNPQLSPFLSQPDYVQMITEVINNPKNVGKHLTDKRFMSTISVLLGNHFFSIENLKIRIRFNQIMKSCFIFSKLR